MEMEIEQEYLTLLDLLCQVIEAGKGSPSGEDERFLEAHGLAVKLVFHSASAYYLSQGTHIPSNISFFDHASIHVLARASLETFLVFHYIFIEPKTQEEKDFRCWAWQLAGSKEGEGFPAQSEWAKEVLESEKRREKELKEKLALNPKFRSLNRDQQKRILQKREWKLKTWREISLAAGLDDIIASDMYRYLCGYAHSGSLSIAQIRQAQSSEIQKKLFAASRMFVLIAIANMIIAYCEVFPKAKGAIKENSNEKELVEKWVLVGQSLLPLR